MSLGIDRGESPGFVNLEAYTIFGALFKYKNTKLDAKINNY
jgi:hypothetical protein